ncbi:4'-phosphopantetheinyl transferase [Ureibacillus massiliensis 4400831 = CIP 108448 = CCUG 49529]|uniref:Holo-[acyl-carrier-protein] synthase n=1 Tax=Ureibacillus massiliensis 4400831 = CIP 108448 = CCUG 49529 TaxID=1211035 RepID=A0A0A3JXX8_9BACL|nr:holo-ACP synthase [Ureibacillus massiliensis]KGR91832.1 4'-phosphopantetheinyl transferase [Ureibacillus massiliensis 4400831 = CIP 108448 = CCUG 49529]RKJ44102.1 holo-[acyl-carrier-protein] synthase [Butyricicoccus sp. 1XD8-22]
MIKGIGLDIIEIERIKKVNEKEKFRNRILSNRELDVYNKLSEQRKIEYLAGRFAAKEAYSKANGTGIREGCEFHQIEILNDELGKPTLYFNRQIVKGFVSITHSKDYAAAQVILMT